MILREKSLRNKMKNIFLETKIIKISKIYKYQNIKIKKKHFLKEKNNNNSLKLIEI